LTLHTPPSLALVHPSREMTHPVSALRRSHPSREGTCSQPTRWMSPLSRGEQGVCIPTPNTDTTKRHCEEALERCERTDAAIRRGTHATKEEITTPLSGARDELYRNSFAGQYRLAGRLKGGRIATVVSLPRNGQGESQPTHGRHPANVIARSRATKQSPLSTAEPESPRSPTLPRYGR